MRIRVLPYKAGSKSAKNLAEALGGLRLRLEGSKFAPRPGDLSINWGNTNRDLSRLVTVNTPDNVDLAINKLESFYRLDACGVRVPPYTDEAAVAEHWSKNDLSDVVVRHKLRGYGADGLEIVEKGLDIPNAPLYTKYVPKKSEWRIHVMNGRVFDVQRKIRDPNDDRPADQVNWQVRNHENGFVYIRGYQKADLNEDVTDQAVRAVAALELEFGAVDVIWNEAAQKAYVLEVNTAPGLEGQTLDNYVNAFKENYA